MKMITLKPIELKSAEINSASSLISVDSRVFTCCDDQYALYELQSDLSWLAHSWANAPVLPSDHHERKRLKPDFEMLLLNQKNILLIPSGSKPNRNQALQFNLLTNRFSSILLCCNWNFISFNIKRFY